jgi:hypothetical protein
VRGNAEPSNDATVAATGPRRRKEYAAGRGAMCYMLFVRPGRLCMATPPAFTGRVTA